MGEQGARTRRGNRKLRLGGLSLRPVQAIPKCPLGRWAYGFEKWARGAASPAQPGPLQGRLEAPGVWLPASAFRVSQLLTLGASVLCAQGRLSPRERIRNLFRATWTLKVLCQVCQIHQSLSSTSLNIVLTSTTFAQESLDPQACSATSRNSSQ